MGCQGGLSCQPVLQVEEGQPVVVVAVAEESGLDSLSQGDTRAFAVKELQDGVAGQVVDETFSAGAGIEVPSSQKARAAQEVAPEPIEVHRLALAELVEEIQRPDVSIGFEVEDEVALKAIGGVLTGSDGMGRRSLEATSFADLASDETRGARAVVSRHTPFS